MRKCFIMNKREYEAFLNVYMMSQRVLGCKYLLLKYSGKRVKREWLYWHNYGLACPNFDHQSVWVTTTCMHKDWQGIWI